MNWFLCIRIALTNLRRNKFRTFLTLVGIIMGIASVTSIYTIGIGFKGVIKDEFEGLGTNTIIIYPFKLEFKKGSGSGTGFTEITLKDLEIIQKEYPEITLVVPKLYTFNQKKISYKNKKFNTNIVGSKPEFFIIGDKKLRLGAYFGDLDVQKANKVCVLGDEVAKELFGDNEDPLGKRVVIGNIPFEVIGVLEKAPKGKMYFGNLDTETITPLTTMQKTLQSGKDKGTIFEARLVASDNTNINELKNKITMLLRQRKKVQEDKEENFTVTTAEQFSELLNNMIKDFTSFLSVVAIISLLIGGIGIMNIMLVSVSERTKEIGIRMALGAREKDITMQFLVEAIIICLIGGALGILLAVPASMAISKGLEWPSKISWWVISAAFIYSSLIGIVFGYYPAKNAASLNPIEALKSE